MQDSRTTAISVDTLASLVGGEVIGDGSRTVVDGATLEDAGPEHVVFVSASRYLKPFAESEARVAIIGRDLREKLEDFDPAGEYTFVLVDDPHRTFIGLLAHVRGQRTLPTIGVSPAAFVDETAVIGADTNVHPAAHVGENVVIGERCHVLPGAYIGPGCRLGNDVTIHPHAVLYGDVHVGNRVTIHATAVIGADGFGYHFHEGRHEKIPHFGHVRIEDDCEIGAGTTVDRGMIGPTVVGEGTKLDNLVMVAHNCRLGKHNILVGQVGFAGSVTTGDYVVIAGQVGVKDHMHLGTGCTVASKAGVNRNIPPGETWIGQPARPLKPALQAASAVQRLPAMRQQVKEMEERLAALEEQLDNRSRAA